MITRPPNIAQYVHQAAVSAHLPMGGLMAVGTSLPSAQNRTLNNSYTLNFYKRLKWIIIYGMKLSSQFSIADNYLVSSII